MQLPRSLAANTTLALATIVSIATFSLLDPALTTADSATDPAGAGHHDHADEQAHVELPPLDGTTESTLARLRAMDPERLASLHDHHDDASASSDAEGHHDDDEHAGHSDEDAHAGHSDDEGHAASSDDDGHAGHTSDPADEELPPLEGTTESTLARLLAMDPERLASLHDH